MPCASCHRLERISRSRTHNTPENRWRKMVRGYDCVGPGASVKQSMARRCRLRPIDAEIRRQAWRGELNRAVHGIREEQDVTIRTPEPDHRHAHGVPRRGFKPEPRRDLA